MTKALFFNGQDTPIAAGLVTKQWVHVNGRTFLIESIPYSSISNQLQQLPQAKNLKVRRGSVRRTAFLEAEPAQPSVSIKVATPMKVAKLVAVGPRLMIDYDILSSTNTLTLQGDTTYPSGSVSWKNNSFTSVGVLACPSFVPNDGSGNDGTTNLDLPFHAYNNLFRGKYLNLTPILTSTGVWIFSDNLFDQVEIGQDPDQPIDAEYNGYWLGDGSLFEEQRWKHGDK